MHARTFRTAALATASLAFSLAACGGRQSGGDGDDCRTVSARLAGDALADALVCAAATLPPAEAAESCRTVTGFADRANAAAVGAAARCVLAAGERSDGAWLAELLSLVVDDADSVDAIVAAMAESFVPAEHGNSFAAALTRAAQQALGARLGDLPAELRASIVEVALGYSLEPLATLAAPWARELDPADPSVALYADSVDDARNPTPMQGWALAASGRWSADDILDCADRDGRCAGWEGEPPLTLLAVTAPADEITPAPDNGVRILRRGDASPAELDAVALWLGRGEYPHAADILPALLVLLTDGTAPEASRRAVAGAASPALCSPERLGDIATRVHFDDRVSAADASTPWSTFIAGCAEHWDARGALTALGAIGWLEVPLAVIDAIRTRLADVAGGDCAALGAASSEAIALLGEIPSRRNTVVEASRAGGGACSELDAQVRAVAASGIIHPAAVLSAGLLQVSRGDRGGCDALGVAAGYRDGNDPLAPGALADAMRAQLEAACE